MALTAKSTPLVLLFAAFYSACVVSDDLDVSSTDQADTVISTPLSDDAVAVLVLTGHAFHEVRVKVTNQALLHPFTCRLTAEQWKIPAYIWNPADGYFPDREGWYPLKGAGEATTNGTGSDDSIEWRFPIATAIWFPLMNHFRFTVECRDASGAWVNTGTWLLDVPPPSSEPLFPFTFTMPPAGNAPPPVQPQPGPGPVVPIAPPPAPAGHCSCNVTCTGNFFETWVDVYGITPAQCNHNDPSMQAAEAATCPNWGVGTKRACNWVN
jgi:hypothetical protein